MWVRGEVFDHGLVHVQLGTGEAERSGGARQAGAGTGLSAAAGATSHAGGAMQEGLDRVGRCVADLRQSGLGQWLRQRAGKRVAKVLHEAMSRHCETSEVEALALTELFFALEPVPADSALQEEGRFALFLVVQLASHSRGVVGKEDLTVWPSADDPFDDFVTDPSETPLQLQSPRSIAMQAISKENQTHLDFVLHFLREICWVLSLCEQESTRPAFLENWRSQELSSSLAGALRFLFGDENNLRSISPHKPLKCSAFERWVKETLDLNNAVNPTLSTSATPGSNNASVTLGSPAPEVAGVGSTPPGSGAHNILVLSGVRRGTAIRGDVNLLARSKQPADGDDASVLSLSSSTHIKSGNNNNNNDRASAEANSPSQQQEEEGNQQKVVATSHSEMLNKVVVFDCTNATVYALHPSKYVRIVGCAKTTVVLGPCAGVVTMEHCTEVELIAITGRLTMGNCYDCKIHVHTTRASPVLFGECRGIEFGPYNTSYPRLLRHLDTTNLRNEIATHDRQFLWRRPLNITARSGGENDSKSGSNATVWSELPASEFQPFVTPFVDLADPGSCRENPIPLPPEYAKALQFKTEKVKAIIRLIADAKPPREERVEQQQQTQAKSDDEGGAAKRIQLEQSINSAFREWLVSAGKVRELVDLVKHQ